MPLFQRLILILQLVADFDERIHTLFESFEFVLKGCIDIIGHMSNIDTRPGRINSNAIRGSRTWPELPLRGIIGPRQTGQSPICMEQIIQHDELDSALRRCGSTWDAAQTHGLLSGCLAIAGGESGFGWLSQVLEGTDAGDPGRNECEVLLSALFESTYRQLSERQSEFEPLLPDYEDSAAVCVAALAHWCEGFLHGLVSSEHGDALKERLSNEPLSDIIKDMLQITRACAGDEIDDESDEESYTELVEYLRVAAQLTYEELVEFRQPPAGEDEVVTEQEVLH